MSEKLSSLGRGQVVLAAFLFSTGGAAIKGCALSGLQIASFRSIIAAAFLVVVLPQARRWTSWRILPVALTYGATMLLFVLATKETTAANAIFMQSTAPFYILLLAPWILKERSRLRDLPYILLFALGMVFLFSGEATSSQLAPNPRLGNLFGLGTGLCWGLTLIGIRWLEKKPSQGNGISAVALGNALLGLATFFWAFDGSIPQGHDLGSILYLGTVQIGVAYLFLVRGVASVPALESSLLIMLEPVLNPLWTWMLYGEMPGKLASLGGILILGAAAARTFFVPAEE